MRFSFPPNRSTHGHAFAVVAVLLGASLASDVRAEPQGEKLDFVQDVRPLLASRCFPCHGSDEENRQAELRLDVREEATAKRNGVPAIVPGDASRSELVLRARSEDPDTRMPPPDSGYELTAAEVERLVRWIEEGATYARHWAYVAPQRPPLPAVKRGDWPRNAIDSFVLARMEAAGLTPRPPADRYTLVRRLSLDLTGIPPTLEEADRFVQDRSPDAYEALVDRLLASPQYAEHGARMWLDLARYADTKGYEKDQPRDIWRYRDWVIQALDRDMPYDQFTREQLAGDLLPEPTSDQLLATAFHRNTMTNDEGGTDNEEFRVAAVKDRVDTTIQVWMGLTMGCAKCHSHKFDPISQEDYYRFFALFNQTEDADRSDDAPRVPTPTRAQRAEQNRLAKELDELRKPSEQESSEQESSEQEPSEQEPSEQEPSEQDDRIVELEQKLTDLEKRIPETPVMRELPQQKRRATHVHVRGNFLEPGKKVEPGVPAAFAGLDLSVTNRLEAVEWLMAPENPLTARVTVNRYWARFFGRGLVETEEDFGVQGGLPSHPQLLDWLAIEFRETHRWSLKQLCKTIVMSATYRQSARVDEAGKQTDPENRLLARFPRVRLSAEAIRDQALAAGGLLSLKVGGPSVMPPQPPGIWATTYSSLKWTTNDGPDRYRRGLYTFWRRTSPYPSLTTFDAASREVCVVRRVRTNTPLQALVTLNDPVFVEAAGGLGRRMYSMDPNASIDTRLRQGFRHVLVRPPEARELEQLSSLYHDARREFEQHPQAAAKLLETARVPADEMADPEMVEEQAAWIVLGNALLNLDETLMRN